MDNPQSTQSPPRKWLRWIGNAGPGFIGAIGVGDYVSNTTIGASHGYSLLWALIIALAFRFLWLNTSAKYVLTTGETLAAGIRRTGAGTLWFLVFAMFLNRHLRSLYHIVILGASIHLLLPLPTAHSSAIWSVFFSVIGFSMMIWGGYSVVERVCRILIALMGVSLVVAVVMCNPSLPAVATGIFVPSLPEREGLYGTIFLLTALLGSQVSPASNIGYAYFIREKGWRTEGASGQQRTDLIMSVIMIFIVASCLQIAAAATVGGAGTKVQSFEDLVHIYTVQLGLPGRIIFTLGIWAAVFNGYVGNTTSYALVLTDICRKYVPRLKKDDSERVEPHKDRVFRYAVAFWAFSPMYILLTGARPVGLVLLAASAVVLVTPVITLALMRITSSKELMGDKRNGWLTNAGLGLLVAVALYLVYNNAVELWARFVL